jgi:uncharacterized protein (TIGR03437 family)
MRALILFSALACAAFAQSPVVAPGGVLNGASFDKTAGAPVAPGALISIFGTDLSAASLSADTVPLSTSLSSVTVTFNGIAAPLKDVVHNAANGDQINAQVPWEVLPAGTASGTAQVVVSRNGVTSAPMSVPLAASAPGIFSVSFGVGQAIAYGNSDGQIAAAAGSIPGLTTHPAKIGDPTTLVILATGLGPVNPPVKTGDKVTDGGLHPTVTTPTVLVGGVPADVKFAGMTPQFVGVYQINIVIAAGTPVGNAVPLQIRIGNVTTTDKVTIAVQQ